MRGLSAVLVVVLAGCGGVRSAAHHPAGPPVTAQALRAAIERSGLTIKWHDGRTGGEVIADVAGEARDRATGGRLTFEIAVARDKASESMLGRARYKLDYYDDVNAVPRGVLRNLAYAIWVASDDDSDATDRVSARLDEAILNAFPADDAEAHPILSSPPE